MLKNLKQKTCFTLKIKVLKKSKRNKVFFLFCCLSCMLLVSSLVFVGL